MKLHTESLRLEQELSKVLRENEELFKTKQGSSTFKGVSANAMYAMKKKVKELENVIATKDQVGPTCVATAEHFLSVWVRGGEYAIGE